MYPAMRVHTSYTGKQKGKLINSREKMSRKYFGRGNVGLSTEKCIVTHWFVDYLKSKRARQLWEIGKSLICLEFKILKVENGAGKVDGS